MKRIAYLISSYFTYAPLSLPVLLKSMREHGVPREQVFAIVCGAAKTVEQIGPDCTFWHVTHNSRNFSPFVEAVNPERSATLAGFDYIFLLMCTSEIGPKFLERTQQIPDGADVVGAHDFHNYGRAQCDIGAYSLDYLRSRKEVIDQHYRDTTDEFNIAAEGLMFAEAANRAFYADGKLPMREIPPHRDIYGVGGARITEYYESVDLTKYKANWGQNGRTLLDCI